ncbi:hypothetical protein MMC30_005409 [Trapelia coarctata]|nr:hypothetical protein [Trapelia coarctata]
MCIPENGQLNLNAGQDTSWDHIVIDEEFIQQNVCLDPCRGWPNPNGGSLFRSDDDYRAFTKADVNLFIDMEAALSGDPKTEKQMNQRLFLMYLNPGMFLLLYILLQGIWATLFGRRLPRRVKNIIYDWGCSLKVPYLTPNGAKGQRKDIYTGAQRLQRWGVKYFALTVYLYAVFAAVLCIPMLVGNVLATEYWLNSIPTSETLDHIGAWAPLAATGLIMFAVVLHHVQGHVWKNVKKILVQARMRPLHIPHEIGRRWRSVRRGQQPDTEKGSRPGLEESHRKHSEGLYPKIVRKTGWSALKTLRGPLTEIRDHINIIRNFFEEEWFYLKSFYKDPDDRNKFFPQHRTDHHARWKEEFDSRKNVSRPLSAQWSEGFIQLDANPSKVDPAAATSLVASPTWHTSSLQTPTEPDHIDITDSARPPSYNQTPSPPVRQPSRRRTTSSPAAASDSDSERQSLLAPSNHSPSSSRPCGSAASTLALPPLSSSQPPPSARYESLPSSNTPSSHSVSASLSTDAEIQHLLSPSPSVSLSPSPSLSPSTIDATESQIKISSPTRAMSAHNAELQRPFSTGGRSTMSYLQIRGMGRETEVEAWGQEVRLRRGGDGVFEVVEGGW